MESSIVYRQKIYGLVQRILHGWIGLTVTALVGLGWGEKLLEAGTLRISMTQIHIVLGYALSAGLAGRFIWAVIGPHHARLGSLWQGKASGELLKSGKSKASFGHDPIASMAYLALYALLAGAVGTGLLLAGMRYDQGPFAERMFDDLVWHEWTLALHNLVLYGATLFIGAHFVGMIRQERKTGVPVAQSMVSGYQYRRVDKENT